MNKPAELNSTPIVYLSSQSLPNAQNVFDDIIHVYTSHTY